MKSNNINAYWPLPNNTFNNLFDFVAFDQYVTEHIGNIPGDLYNNLNSLRNAVEKYFREKPTVDEIEIPNDAYAEFLTHNLKIMQYLNNEAYKACLSQLNYQGLPTLDYNPESLNSFSQWIKDNVDLIQQKKIVENIKEAAKKGDEKLRRNYNSSVYETFFKGAIESATSGRASFTQERARSVRIEAIRRAYMALKPGGKLIMPRNPWFSEMTERAYFKAAGIDNSTGTIVLYEKKDSTISPVPLTGEVAMSALEEEMDHKDTPIGWFEVTKK